MSQDKKNIEEIFRDALEHHETAVSPKVWAGVESSIGSSIATTSVSGGSVFLGKAGAIIGISALIAGATISEIYHASPKGVVVEEVSEKTSTQTNTIETRAEAVDFADQGSSPDQKITADNSDETASEKKNETSAVSETYKKVNTSLIKEKAGSTEAATPKQEIAASQQTSVAPKQTTASSAKNDASDKASKPSEKPEIIAQNPESNQPSLERSTEPKSEVTFENIPNIFSPNGDGIGDNFSIKASNVEQLYIRIFNGKTRELVFESRDPNFEWDGNDRFGQPVPEGLYFYIISATDQNGLPYKASNAQSNLTVKR